MLAKRAVLMGAFMIVALAGGDVARGAARPDDTRGRLSLLRLVVQSVDARIERRLREAAALGPAEPLTGPEAERLSAQVAHARALLEDLGPSAALADERSVHSLGVRLAELTGEAAPGTWVPGFAPQAGTGRIGGIVTNANTAAPLDVIEVDVYDCAGHLVTKAFTDPSGVYFTDAILDTGTYFAATLQNSFARKLYANAIFPADGDVTVGTPISVVSGSTTGGINFQLTPGGLISGAVTGTAGAPIPTTVTIFDAAGNPVTTALSSDTAGGAFITTEGLRPGTYYAWAAGAGRLMGKLFGGAASCPFIDSCNPTTGTPIVVTEGAITPGVNFSLVQGGRISGTVTAAADGTGLNSYVYVMDSTGKTVDTPISDSTDGGFYATDTGLPPGTYFLRTGGPFAPAYVNEIYNNVQCDPTCTFTIGAPVAVSTGLTTTGIDFALEKGSAIGGRVLNGGTGAYVFFAQVTAYNADGVAVRSTIAGAPGPLTNDNYLIEGLAAGSYFLRVTPLLPGMNLIPTQYNGNLCAPCATNSGTAVTAPGRANFVLFPGGQITGKVSAAATGAGIGDVTVGAYTAGGLATGRTATTSCTGDYSIDSLPTGSYRELVTATGLHSRRFRSEAFDDLDCGTGTTCSVASGTPIPVFAGSATTNIDSALTRYSTVADFNRDRRTDLGIYDPVSGLWFIRNQFTQGYGGPGATIVPGDYDGDLKTDLAVYYEASGLWYVRRSSTGTDLVQGFGGPGYKPVPGDYDGDGKTDFAVFHDASGIWFIKQSSNGATVSFGFGSAGATLVPADYDRDGKTDAAIYYESSGLWYIRQSSTLTTFSTGYGGTGYKPVRGDFDGDGRADIAVYHAPSGFWFIRNWTTAATTSVAFGAAGYTPVPGDYDGDARTDLAVYDPVSGLWFSRAVTGGPTTVIGFGGPGYVPVVIR